MATKQQAEIKGVETVGDQQAINSDFVIVWSALRAPLTLTMPVSRYNNSKVKGAHHETMRYTLKPGPNRVPRALWEHSAKRETIIKRIDNRDLVPARSATKAPAGVQKTLDAITVGEPPPKAASIRDLCPAGDKVTMKAAMRAVGAPSDLHDLDSPDAIRLED